MLIDPLFRSQTCDKGLSTTETRVPLQRDAPVALKY